MAGYNYHLKKRIEIEYLRRAAQSTVKLLDYLENYIKIGTSLIELERRAFFYLKNSNLQSALPVFDEFPAVICLSLNEVAAHGLPYNVKLKSGDILTIDASIIQEGWCGDAARTYVIGKNSPLKEKLRRAAWYATQVGITRARYGNRLGDIGASINAVAQRFGFQVIARLSGHGIGRSLHEEPNINSVSRPGAGDLIEPGMVFTIEPVLTVGKCCPEVFTGKDGWSLITVEETPTAQFEHTVAVFPTHTDVLTADRPKNKKLQPMLRSILERELTF